MLFEKFANKMLLGGETYSNSILIFKLKQIQVNIS